MYKILCLESFLPIALSTFRCFAPVFSRYFRIFYVSLYVRKYVSPKCTNAARLGRLQAPFARDFAGVKKYAAGAREIIFESFELNYRLPLLKRFFS